MPDRFVQSGYQRFDLGMGEVIPRRLLWLEVSCPRQCGVERCELRLGELLRQSGFSADAAIGPCGRCRDPLLKGSHSIVSLHLLSDGPTAINRQDRAGDEAIRLVCQKEDRAGNLLRFGPAAERMDVADCLRGGRVLKVAL